MKGKLTIAGALLFVAVYVSSCVVPSHHGYHDGRGGYRNNRSGGNHSSGGGGVRHYGR